MSPNQPPQGFFDSGEPGPPPPAPRKKRAALGIILLLSGILVFAGVVGVGAVVWLTASSEAPSGGFARVPEDGKRHYDMQWQLEGSPTKASLRGVWSSGEAVHAVGDDGVIVTRDTTGTWAAQSSGTKANLHAITSTSAGMMAVGDAGTVVVFDRASRTWSLEETGTDASLRAVTSVGREVVAVGTKGTILRRFAKDDWRAEAVGVDVDLHALSANASDLHDRGLYAAGVDGTILYRASNVAEADGGSAWIVQASGTKAGIFGLKWGRNQVLAAGQGGEVLRLRTSADTPWTRDPVPGTPDLLAADFANVSFQLRRPGYSQSGAEPCWLVAGKGGFVAIRPDQGSGPWHVFDPRPTTENLLAAASGRGDLIVLVGENGTIVTGSSNRF